MASDLVVPTTGGDGPAPQPAPEPPPRPPRPLLPSHNPPPAPIAVPSAAGTRRRQIVREYADARRVTLTAALQQASKAQPDAAAKTLALADRTPLSSDVVGRNLDQVSEGLSTRDRDAAGIAARHPRLAAWLSDPDNASISHDELPTLRTLDLAVRQVADPHGDHTNLLPPGFIFSGGEIREKLPGGLSIGVGGFADLDHRLSEIDRANDIQRETADAAGGNFAVGFKRSIASTLNVFGGAPEAARVTDRGYSAAAYTDPSFMGDLVRGAGGLAADLPLLVAGGAFGRLARGIEQIQGLGRFARGAAETAAASQPFAIREGLESQRQNGDAAGAISWLIETATPAAFGAHGAEKGLIDIAGRLAGDAAGHEASQVERHGLGGAIRHLLGEAASEGTEEAVTELAHALHEQIAGIDPQALDADRLLRRLATAGVLGAVAGAGFNLPEMVASGALRAQHDAGEAIAYRDRVAALVEVAGQAKTAERSASRFDELVRTLKGDKDAPVFLQTGDWDATWRAAGVDPSKAAGDAGLARQYLEAKATGSEMPVPLEAFTRQAQQAPALVDHARAAPGAPSAAEAQATAKALPAEVQAALEREAAAGKPAAGADARPDTAPQVGAAIAAQLTAAGTAPDAAEKLGQVYEHIFRTLGERLGADPVELFNRFGLDVSARENGADAQEPAALPGEVAQAERVPAGSIRLNRREALVARRDAFRRGELDQAADPTAATGRYPAARSGGAVAGELGQPGGGGRRLGGFVPSRLASDGLSKIFLYEGRNLSTFLHESGHFFLEVLGDLAGEANAPAQIRADYQAVLGWFGVESRDQIEEKHHERFARGFEAYLFEGKSPVAALRRVFARLRAWLLDVYKGLAGLSQQAGHQVELPAEIAAVFDRLIATDAEIAAAEDQASAGGIFATPEDAGMTPEGFAGYRRVVADAHERGVAKLQAQVLKRLTAEEQAHQDQVRAELHAQAAADLDREPVFHALAVLQRGDLPEGIPAGSQPLKLSKEGLLSYLKPEDLSSLPGPGKGRPNRGRHIYATEGGIHPEAAAQLFGFTSGDELVQALRNAPDRDTVLDAVVAAKLQQRFPDPVGPVQLEDRAAAAVENDERETVLAMELAALARLKRAAKPIAKQAAAEATAAERQRGDNRLADARQHADAEAVYEKAAAKAKLDTLKAEQRAKQAALDQAAKSLVAAFRPDREDGDPVPPIQSFRAAAEKVVAGTLVKDLKPGLYLAAARRAGKESFDAAARRQYGDAFEAKQREILNHELYRAARDAKEAADATREYLKRFDDQKTRERVGKAGGWEWTVRLQQGDQRVPTEEAARALSAANGNAPWSRTSGYLEQIDKLLERFEFRTVADSKLDRRQTLKEWIEAVEASGADVVIPDQLRDDAFRTNWRQLTVEQLAGLRDSVKNIEALARLKNKLSKAQKDADYDQAVGSIVAAVEANVRRRKDTDPSGDRGRGDKAADFIDAAIAGHRKLSSYARQADGGKAGGSVWEHLVRPFNDAADAEVEMRSKEAARLAGLMEAWRAGGKSLGPDAHKVHIPAISRSLSLESRIAVALNWGNAGNRERVLSGERWSEAQAQAVLDTLDAADWKLVQGIWDQINAHWSEIAALEQRLTGVAPEKVEAAPVPTRFGTFAGGYYPVKYDPARSPRADQQQQAAAGKLYALGEAGRATTRRGHLKARSEGLGKPLRLDLDVVSQHLAQVIHDLTHREAVRDADRLLADDQVATALHDHLGRAALDVIKAVVKDVAASDLHDNAVDRALRWMRSGVSIATMGFNIGSALMQVTGFAQSAQLVGTANMARAVGRIFSREGMPEGALAFVNGKSRFMRSRAQTAVRESTEVLNQVRGTAWRQNLTQWAYFLMQRAQTMVDLPTWMAAYESALEGGREDVDAVAIADQAIIDAQGSGLTKDLAGVQRSRVTSLFTVFYSYFSTTFNRTAEAWASARRADWTPEAVGRLTLDMLYLYVIPAVMTAGLRALKGAGGDDDKREAFGTLVAKETLANAMGTVIGLRDLSSPLLDSFEYRGPGGAMGFATLAELISQAKQGELDAGLVKAAARTAGIMFHIPTSQVIKTIDGFASLETAGWTAPIFGPPPKR